MLDLLLKGGLIVDGTGNEGFYGAAGVQGETLRIIRGDVSSIEAARVIDASGHVVTPGFIDVHAHSGLVMLAEPRHEPKVRQGVTTELIGVDGNSYAPFKSHDDFLRFVELNSGLDGNPPLPGRWSSVAEYLSMFDRRVAVNVAYIIGNSPLRIATVGWNNRPPTVRELADMKALLREGGLPTWRLRRHGRARRAVSRGGPTRRHLSHSRPLSPRRPVPRPFPRGHRDRPPERDRGPHHAPVPASPEQRRRESATRPG